MSDALHELTRPFPDRYVHDDGKGNAYVPHHIVTQRLIHIFGVPPKIELIREIYDKLPDGSDKLTGVVMRLTVPGFEPIEEAGEADNPQAKTNGARLKSAASDAIKRCAMRLGLGLHLWAQDDYFLFTKLSEGGEVSASARPSQPSTTQTGGDAGADVSGTGTDNEGARNRDDKVDDGAVGSSKPAPVSEVVPGSAPRDAEPGGDEATADDSPPPATDLVEVYGKNKVFNTAYSIAKANNFTPLPASVEDINEALAVLVGKKLEKAS